MLNDATVLTLTPQEIMRLEMIVIDGDTDDALEFARELRAKVRAAKRQGMTSHLDA